MIKIEFNQEEINELRYYRYNHPHPRVQRKIDVLLLKSKGIPHKTIAEITGICTNTLRNYLREYQSGGLEKLKEINFFQPESKLAEHRQSLKQYFSEHPVSSINEAISKIEEITGLKRSPTRVRHFLKKLGFKCQKVGMIPSKADPDVQESFKKKELEPRLEEAKQGKRVVFFVDAAHFVLAPFLGFLWTLTRIFIKAPSGRKRFNVLGALNAITHELIKVTNDTYINAQSVCDLLEKINKLNLGLPITLILDNAR